MGSEDNRVMPGSASKVELFVSALSFTVLTCPANIVYENRGKANARGFQRRRKEEPKNESNAGSR